MTSPSTISFMNTKPSILEEEMHVTKRNGHLETVSFDKILRRIKSVGKEVGIQINYTALVIKVIDQLYDGISTTKIDELTAEQCASMSSIHYDYNVLAGRILISNHQKNTPTSFSKVMQQLHWFIDKNEKPSPLVSDELIAVVKKHKSQLDALCDYSRDYLIDYFGFKTLERSYLMRVNGKVVERPQHMWLRVAIGIHGASSKNEDIDSIIETYQYMSQRYFIHATPTLFNAGTNKPQLSSCYLLSMESDSIDGIYNTLKDCALISKMAGGIGLHIHNVRATGSHIRGTNGTSNGIVPMLRVFNNTARYVDQCVHPDTIIYTDEGPKQIKSCISGRTQIFNQTGNLERIQNVLEHFYEGPIFIIWNEFTQNTLYVTPEHPIYIVRENSDTPEWLDAKDILITDKMVYSIPTYENDVENIKIDDCQIYIWLYLYGGIHKEDGIYFIDTKNLNIDVIKEYLDHHLVQYKVINGHIIWSPALHLPFRYGDLYNDHREKHIHSRWLFLSEIKTQVLYNELSKQPHMKIREYIQWFRLRLGIGFDPIKGYPNLRTSKVISIQPSVYKGILYDLQMGIQHDYLLETGIVHNGGGKRNGSFAIYLEPWHADIEVFLQMRKNHGDEEMKARDLFYALWIPDLFMERIKANGKWTLMCPDECPGLSDVYGPAFAALYEKYEAEGKGRETVNARDLWFRILDAQMETGTPYILYKDAANQKSNQKNLGTIKSSNLCVAPETLVLTDKGHKEIISLKDQQVNVWNGKEFSEVTVKQTGEDQELIDIYTDDGLKLSCTPYHKFYIQNTHSLSSTKQIEAQQLQPGDKLIKCDYPIIDGNESMLYPYTHGFFCGDGTYRNITEQEPSPCKFTALPNHHFCKRHLFNETVGYIDNNDDIQNYVGNCKALSYSKLAIIYLYDNKKELVSHLDYRIDPIYDDIQNKIVVTLPSDIAEKFEVPSAHCSLKTKLEWFAGYCDADGTISINGTNEQLQVGSINHDFLIKVKLMLQTCGINPKIKLSSSRETSYLPDGNGGYKYFDVKPLYRLLITSCDLYQLVQQGFKTHRLIISGTKPPRDTKQFIKILKIVNENRIDNTYCFTEPKRHMGIFNGIITGQCTEIIEYSDDKETAVCNLASLALPTYIEMNKETSQAEFLYDKLYEMTKIVTKNLNKIIDVNFYPTEKTKRSNMRHRPIGIGVQGLADVFFLLGLPFASDEAKSINRNIFETIYYAALTASCDLAEKYGPYETFAGSPASQGLLQFDLWSVDPGSSRYDWATLKSRIQTVGLRNSLLLAPMPTASTSQILGFNECIEPITSNIYSRRTLAGDFIQVNKYLMADLIRLDLWNEKIKNNIIANHGSCQQIDAIPQELKDRYKTVWEIPMRNLIDMSADRGAFICQSQSLNLWLEDPTYSNLTSMHFYSWSKGLKTGIYYLRRRAKHQAQQFTIEPEKGNVSSSSVEEDDHICEMCSA